MQFQVFKALKKFVSFIILIRISNKKLTSFAKPTKKTELFYKNKEPGFNLSFNLDYSNMK